MKHTVIPFTKMHGCGNDYIYVDCFRNKIENPAELARAASRQHFGLGSDGLILVCPPTGGDADIRMRIFNADGSEAEMCGNGARCVAKFAYENGLVNKKEIRLETLAGIKHLVILKNGNVCVDMGEPIVDGDKVIEGYSGKVVSVGNPHFVIILNKGENLEKVDLAKIGPKIENSPAFPNRTNTEFIKIVNRSNIRMRVWERGAGETLACGTGACASVAACNANEMTEGKVSVHLLGGKLLVEWNKSDNHIYMTGNAETIGAGEYFFQKQR
jgi:diaminopimelate epimerase